MGVLGGVGVGRAYFPFPGPAWSPGVISMALGNSSGELQGTEQAGPNSPVSSPYGRV